jgi:ribonuclease HI
MQFQSTNIIAGYEALLLGLRKLKAMGIQSAVLKLDSQVITGEVDKSSKVKKPNLEKYLDMVRRRESSFEGFSVKTSQGWTTSMWICWPSLLLRGSPYLPKCF